MAGSNIKKNLHTNYKNIVTEMKNSTFGDDN